MKNAIGDIIDGLKGETSTQYGRLNESTINEDEWKTMHGAHILIDGDGDIIAGGPKEMRKNVNGNSKKEVSKDTVKSIKGIHKAISISGSNKGTVRKGLTPWDIEHRPDSVKKNFDRVKKFLVDSAKSDEDKEIAKKIGSAMDKALNTSKSEYSKGVSASKMTAREDFVKDLKDLGVPEDSSFVMARKLGLL